MAKKTFFSFLIPLFLLTLFFINLQDLEENKKTVKSCNELNYEEGLFLHPKNFSTFKLEIIFPSEKSWKRNTLRANLNAKNNEKKYNFKYFKDYKRVDANIKIFIANKITCVLKARVRPHGLLDDHRDGSNILPSLNVNLKNGNIFGITKFILFRPQTRMWDSEILISTLFNELGYLSPRTTKVKLQYNDQVSNFTFQEKASKEFLEANSLREGPMYEGDNRFANYFNDNPDHLNLSKHKLINNGWSLVSLNNLKISQQGLSILNKYNEHFVDNLKKIRLVPSDYFSLEKERFSSSYFENYDVYDALNYALRTAHGLSSDDRTYYYDPFYKKFHPVYWDGMSELLTRFNKLNPIEKKQIIIPSAKHGSIKAIEKLKSLNLKEFEKKLKKNGVSITKANLEKIFEKIQKNASDINKLKDNELANLTFNKQPFDYFNQPIRLNTSNLRMVFYDKNFSNFLICKYYSEDCEKKNFNNIEISKMLNQRFNLNQKDFLFVGKNINNEKEYIWFHDHFDTNQRKIGGSTNVLGDVNFITRGNISFKIDEENKIISFEKNSKFGNVTFFNGKLDDWSIKFNINVKDPYPGIDERNLTGCLNFYDVKIKNISLDLRGSNCEDSVNFVRSTGIIKEITIKNSLYDSLDADFSNLIIKNIFVEESKNDCLDFSFGDYQIEKAQLNLCGDKGISVGEISTVKIIETKIKNSKVGVATKDFAETKIENIQLNKVDTCYQVYNKKTEFAGGFLKINKSLCKNNFQNYQVDKRSKIEINNEL